MSPPGTILIVDDEVLLAASLRRVLQRAGYEVSTVRSGEDALALLEVEAVSLVISDMLMPGMSGLELLAAIRDRWPQTTRLLFSGNFVEGEATINQPVFHAWLPKPWDNAQLVALISRFFPHKRAPEQLAPYPT